MRLSPGARIATVVTASSLAGGAAGAGPLDRSGRPVGAIFEEGNYVEFSLTHVDPRVEGEGTLDFDPLAPLRAVGAEAPPIGVAGAGTGDVAESFTLPGAAVKVDLGRGLSAALIYDEPFGADTSFPLGTGFYAAGTRARVDTRAATGLVRFRHPSGFSVHGGARYQTYETAVDVPLVFAPPGEEAVVASILSGEAVRIDGYRGRGARDGGWGYVLGVAYEVPRIALRASLTYSSEIDHELDIVETGPVPGRSTLPITTPRSLDLELRTGVAPGTLVFGGVRWTQWSEFAVRPQGYFAATGSDIVSYDDDSFDWTLGVGRQLTERFSGAVSLGYGGGGGGDFVSILGPTDGVFSVAVGGTYVAGPVELTAGISHAWLGDAESSLDDALPAASFEDNRAVGVLAKIAYRF